MNLIRLQINMSANISCHLGCFRVVDLTLSSTLISRWRVNVSLRSVRIRISKKD